MGSNVSPARIKRAGESLAPVQEVCQVFKKQTAFYVHSGKYPYPGFGQDFHKILSVLIENTQFAYIQGRSYSCFISSRTVYLLCTPRKSLLSELQLHSMVKDFNYWSACTSIIFISIISMTFVSTININDFYLENHFVSTFYFPTNITTISTRHFNTIFMIHQKILKK